MHTDEFLAKLLASKGGAMSSVGGGSVVEKEKENDSKLVE